MIDNSSHYLKPTTIMIYPSLNRLHFYKAFILAWILLIYRRIFTALAFALSPAFFTYLRAYGPITFNRRISELIFKQPRNLQGLLVLCMFGFSIQAQNTLKAPMNANVIIRTVQWTYGGYIFYDQLTFSYNDYLYYQSLPKTQNIIEYASEDSSHPYLLQVAKVLDQDAKELGYTGYMLVGYLTAFVQQAIPYQSDPYNNGWDYPKYPIETLVEQGGDCEDKSALLVALLKTFGFDALLVGLPGHMAVGISCSNCNGYYRFNGKKYAFIETTEKGWGIGDVPALSRYAEAILLPTADLKVYDRGDQFAFDARSRSLNTKSDSKINIVIINGVIYLVSD